MSTHSKTKIALFGYPLAYIFVLNWLTLAQLQLKLAKPTEVVQYHQNASKFHYASLNPKTGDICFHHFLYPALIPENTKNAKLKELLLHQLGILARTTATIWIALVRKLDLSSADASPVLQQILLNRPLQGGGACKTVFTTLLRCFYVWESSENFLHTVIM